MQSTKKENNFQNKLQSITQYYPNLMTIVHTLAQHNAHIYLVGGAVRDLLLDRSIKDIDIEVHGISLETLEQLLQQFGPVSLVGKIYGVLRLHNLNIDWSVPRSDLSGRKPLVELDPYMDLKQAFARRDLTINAMGIDMVTGKLIDPFNGLYDLHHGILRTPDPALFVQDPLRFFRVMQFVARFEMQPDAQLNDLCKSMDISGVSKERIEVEFQKMLLQSRKPSLGIEWLNQIDRLQEILPEVAACKGIPQNPQWHPEGDVYEHTKQALDASAQLEYADGEEKLIIMYAALCHDLGKVTMTKLIDGVIRSLKHEYASEKLTKKLMRRIVCNKELIKCVALLVRYHMCPVTFVVQHAKLSAYKRLANKIAPNTLRMLWLLARADRRGRNPQKNNPLTNDDPEVMLFLQRAQEAHVLDEQEKPILLGRDLMPEIEPGPLMGKILKKVYQQFQISKGIKDKKELKKIALDLYKKIK